MSGGSQFMLYFILFVVCFEASVILTSVLVFCCNFVSFSTRPTI